MTLSLCGLAKKAEKGTGNYVIPGTFCLSGMDISQVN